jgi:hypothetical protein
MEATPRLDDGKDCQTEELLERWQHLVRRDVILSVEIEHGPTGARPSGQADPLLRQFSSRPCDRVRSSHLWPALDIAPLAAERGREHGDVGLLEDLNRALRFLLIRRGRKRSRGRGGGWPCAYPAWVEIPLVICDRNQTCSTRWRRV